MIIKTCLICGIRRGSGDYFCWKCGARLLETEMHCPDGHWVEKTDVFCSTCGVRLEHVETPETAN